jgi:hypothetical protein
MFASTVKSGMFGSIPGKRETNGNEAFPKRLGDFTTIWYNFPKRLGYVFWGTLYFDFGGRTIIHRPLSGGP